MHKQQEEFQKASDFVDKVLRDANRERLNPMFFFHLMLLQASTHWKENSFKGADWKGHLRESLEKAIEFSEKEDV